MFYFFKPFYIFYRLYGLYVEGELCQGEYWFKEENIEDLKVLFIGDSDDNECDE